MSNFIRGLDRTPSIAALEKILNDPDGGPVQINPDGSVSTGLRGLAKKVQELEEDSQTLAEIRATLWLNFGEGDGCRNRYGFVLKESRRPLHMLMEVLEHFVAKHAQPVAPMDPDMCEAKGDSP
jgi:hypothetical protein